MISQNTIDLIELNKVFVDLLFTRNNLAIENGYPNYVELMRNKRFQIPDREWANYHNLVSMFCSRYSVDLSIKKSYPHFLSQITEVKIDFPQGVINLFEDVSKHRDIESSIEIKIGGQQAEYRYDKMSDKYLISIPNVSPNQKIAMLIHELSHVVSHENIMNHVRSTYEDEKLAYKIEFNIAKKISKDFFEADVREYLQAFLRTDFELTAFEDPEKVSAKLFSRIANKYFTKVDGQTSTLYLFDKKLIYTPLFSMPHAVAIMNTLVLG